MLFIRMLIWKKNNFFWSWCKTSKNLPGPSQPPVGFVFPSESFETIQRMVAQIYFVPYVPCSFRDCKQHTQGASLCLLPTWLWSQIVPSLTKRVNFKLLRYEVSTEGAQEFGEIFYLSHVKRLKNHTELYIGVSTLRKSSKRWAGGRCNWIWHDTYNIRDVMQMKDHELQPNG